LVNRVTGIHVLYWGEFTSVIHKVQTLGWPHLYTRPDENSSLPSKNIIVTNLPKPKVGDTSVKKVGFVGQK
jgi:hypothetical protein